VKGAAGAAVQCFNLMTGFPEERAPTMPLFRERDRDGRPRCRGDPRPLRRDAAAGKPLAEIDGRPMIWYVWSKASAAKLRRASWSPPTTSGSPRWCGGSGARRSSLPECASGTDRVAEAARGMDEEILINLQGTSR